MPSLKLALRFLRHKSAGALSGFMSLASTAGIAIGVLALITGLSAMNGFEYELENRVLSVIPQVQLHSTAPNFDNAANQAQSLIQASDAVTAAVPAVEVSAIVHNKESFQPVLLLGLSPDERQVISMENFMSVSLDDLNDADKESPPLVLGKSLAKSFNLNIGDRVSIIYLKKQDPDDTGGGFEIFGGLASHEFILTGTLSIGGQLDNSLAVTTIPAAKALADLTECNTIHVKTNDFLNAPAIVYKASSSLNESASLSSWMNTQGKLYRDIQMIRQVMYLAMIMVMAVACFNIIAALFMQVKERRSEIAILITLGLKPSAVIRIFTMVGLLKGSYGTFIGVVLGIMLSLNLTEAVVLIERLFDTKFLNENIYFINFIPARLEVSDIILVAATAVIMSTAAAIYPAIKASRTDPAKILNGQ